MNLSEEQVKQCENYLKQKTNCKIVEAFGKYIILAHDKKDLKAKQLKIARGDVLGFYITERVFNIIQSNQ